MNKFVEELKIIQNLIDNEEYKKASEKGDIFSSYKLGCIYENEKDYETLVENTKALIKDIKETLSV